MAIAVGDKLPGASLFLMGDEGPTTVDLGEKLAGRKVVIFALPGAYTGVCSTAHVPSFMRTMSGFAEKGVDEVICISVNDAFVMQAWAEATGAAEAGITMLGDPLSEYTKAVGMDFSAPPAGFVDRSKRYALYAEDGVVKVLHAEDSPGTCDISGGEAMLDAI